MSIPKILIVDDEAAQLRLFETLVRRLECEPLVAGNGEEALAILEQETPDLMILDLAMPAVSGIDVLRQIRQDPRLSRIKVVILTARSNMVTEAEALGFDAWVTKPIYPDDLMAIISDMLAPAS